MTAFRILQRSLDHTNRFPEASWVVPWAMALLPHFPYFVVSAISVLWYDRDDGVCRSIGAKRGVHATSSLRAHLPFLSSVSEIGG
jgi:hypothetical protein